jgi:hypothetical protein
MRKRIIKGCESRGDADSPYLTRYTLLATRWFTLCLHIFHRSDAPDLHDHPWDFWSLILWRGYIEQTPSGRRRVWPGMLLRRRAEHVHRVELLPRYTQQLTQIEYMPGRRVLGQRQIGHLPAVTLVLMRPRRRTWGFFTAAGWQPFLDYFTKMGC